MRASGTDLQGPSFIATTVSSEINTSGNTSGSAQTIEAIGQVELVETQ